MHLTTKLMMLLFAYNRANFSCIPKKIKSSLCLLKINFNFFSDTLLDAQISFDRFMGLNSACVF